MVSGTEGAEAVVVRIPSWRLNKLTMLVNVDPMEVPQPTLAESSFTLYSGIGQSASCESFFQVSLVCTVARSSLHPHVCQPTYTSKLCTDETRCQHVWLSTCEPSVFTCAWCGVHIWQACLSGLLWQDVHRLCVRSPTYNGPLVVSF